jgi:amino acid permease
MRTILLFIGFMAVLSFRETHELPRYPEMLTFFFTILFGAVTMDVSEWIMKLTRK